MRVGVNSLVSSISCTKQSNLFVHFLKTKKKKNCMRGIAYLIKKYVNLEGTFLRFILMRLNLKMVSRCHRNVVFPISNIWEKANHLFFVSTTPITLFFSFIYLYKISVFQAQDAEYSYFSVDLTLRYSYDYF